MKENRRAVDLATIFVMEKEAKDLNDMLTEYDKAESEGRLCEADIILTDIEKEYYRINNKNGFDEEEYAIGVIEYKNAKRNK